VNAVTALRLRIRAPDLPGSRAMFANVISIAGSTAITLPLGFVFWWLAARLYPAHAVGVASAVISAMMLLSTFASLGFGTFLIGELPRRPGRGARLLVTALLVVGATGSLLGLAFVLLAPTLSQHLALVSESVWAASLFAAGVALTTVTAVLDQALVGVLRGGLQFWRNATLGIAKLVALAAVSGVAAWHTGLTIIGSWVTGIGISVLVVAAIFLHEGHHAHDWRQEWSLVGQVRRSAALHHALNLTLSAPLCALPIVATTLISPRQGAYFYAAWMIGGVATIIPLAFTTVLYAISAAEIDLLRARLQQTLAYSALAAGAVTVTIIVLGPLILRLFGADYSEQASSALRMIALGGLPLVVKYHFVAVSRVFNDLARAVTFVALGSVLEIGFAAVGAKLGGLDGLAALWVAVVYAEGVIMGVALYRVALR
jgi:O-antigen/teichoic acid export membrane protein